MAVLGPEHLEQSLQAPSQGIQPAVRFYVEDFDNLIEEQGMVFTHFRAMPCPVGRTDRFDIRKGHEDHAGCSNGFLFKYAGEVVGAATGNSRSKSLIDVGLTNTSSMQVTLARHYFNQPEEEIIVAPFDRFYMKENNATVCHAQLFEANVSGLDRLQFPATDVEHLIDSNGKSYDMLKDFSIYKGQIKWIGNDRPAMDPTSGKGQICSIRYRYVPYWYCEKILHEIRVVKVYDEKQQKVVVSRMPYAILLQRENVFEGSARNDPASAEPDNQRQAVAPRQGSFGPR